MLQQTANGGCVVVAVLHGCGCTAAPHQLAAGLGQWLSRHQLQEGELRAAYVAHDENCIATNARGEGLTCMRAAAAEPLPLRLLA